MKQTMTQVLSEGRRASVTRWKVEEVKGEASSDLSSSGMAQNKDKNDQL